MRGGAVVAIWRDAELEAVLGGPLDASGITSASLQRLVDDAVAESEVLDFKAHPHLDGTKSTTLSRDRTWSAGQEFAKDVISFANRRGGLLLLGVEEDGAGVATAVTPVITNPDAVEQQLRQALITYSAPVPRIYTLPVLVSITGSPTYVLAVVVPPSPYAPHAVVTPPGAAREGLFFPVRDGGRSRYMRESEVADKYRQRITGSADRAQTVAETVETGIDAIARTDGTWLYVALVPESRPVTRVDRQEVEAVRTWVDSYGFATPSKRLHLDGAAVPAPERVIISESRWVDENDVEPILQHCELYLDGRSFLATELEANTSGTPEAGVVGTQVIAGDTLNAVHLATEWAADRAGAWGSATVVVGILSNRAGLGALPEVRVRLHENGRGNLYQVPNSRSPFAPFNSEVAVDLGACLTDQDRLAVAYDVLAALLHHFGVAEPEHVHPDGSINARAWEPSRRAFEVEQWASLWGLPVRSN